MCEMNSVATDALTGASALVSSFSLGIVDQRMKDCYIGSCVHFSVPARLRRVPSFRVVNDPMSDTMIGGTQ